MIDIEFLDHLDRMSLIINKRITSNYTGERVSKHTGEGLVFKDYTIYSPGENFRAIDWKVFGRTDKLFIKRFEEERNLTIHVIVDFSASMDFKSAKLKKSEYASMLGIGFAFMAMKNNEKFVLSTFADKLTIFRPKRGRQQLMVLLDHLNNEKPQGLSNLQESLSSYKKVINTKSLIILISDFLYDIDQIRTTLLKLKHNEVKLIQVLDPVEADLNLDGDFKLRDLESKEQLRTYVNPYLRKQYLLNLAKHKNEILKACDEAGAEFYSFSSDKPIFDSFYEVLSHKHAHMG
ncbi:DUF58 domain-containing protein [Candidatus Woesearchaeota archaeon]|nr:DUF58 domain-containing protein [Candidatus Woesearchaeota archaeon]